MSWQLRGGLVLVLCMLLGVRRSLAEPLEGPSVVRGQGAEACPDLAALTAQIAAIGGLADAFSHSGYTVVFAHAATGRGTFSARIRRRDAGGERLLEAPGDSCAPLAKATAVTLALLLDNEARGRPGPPASETNNTLVDPAPLAAPAEQPKQTLPAAPAQPTRRWIDRAALGVGPLGLFGVVRTLSPGVHGQLALDGGRLRLAVGALWVLPHTRALGPGSLEARLSSGVLHLCAATARTRALRLLVCSGAYAGVLAVKADGFTLDRRRHEAWIAIPLELTLLNLWSPIGLSLSAAALLPVRRYDFSIDGLGKAFRSWPVAGLLALRLELGRSFGQ